MKGTREGRIQTFLEFQVWLEVIKVQRIIIFICETTWNGINSNTKSVYELIRVTSERDECPISNVPDSEVREKGFLSLSECEWSALLKADFRL